jgi:hypothetical protein
VAVLPAHIVALLTVGVGGAPIVTLLVTDAVHPAALVAVTVYIPVVAALILGVVAPVLQR